MKLSDQTLTYLTARPAGWLSEFSGGPLIFCSTSLLSAVTLLVMSRFSGAPVTAALARDVNSLPS